jgi:signal transduction histidine kinase
MRDVLEVDMGFFLAGLAAGVVAAILAGAFYHRKVLRRMRAAERKLLDSERLAYLGSLAGGLAHEIKNPLSTLHLNMELLEEDLSQEAGEKGSRHASRLKVMHREVKRLEEVLEDFLRYARRHQLELKPEDLNAVLAETLDFVTPEAEQGGVRISRGFAADLAPVAIDAGRLKQAFLNIIINARQAMPEGGELIVQTRNVPGGVEVSFIDTGTGIGPEDLDRIWDVYYSSKKTGTGLGLPTARRIVEEHEGRIRVETQMGKGSCFTVFLPAEQYPTGE